MKMVILIPSYRRPVDLERCLCALSQQVRAPDQVVVVARLGDDATKSVATAWLTRLPLEIVEVGVPGQVHALNSGLARCRGDIVAITDDDAAPRPDWLERIATHFAADPKLGGVGGRDWIYNDGVIEIGDRKTVGKILWFGRLVGDHHLGAGDPRAVDILKGANFAFRLEALRPVGFDRRLRGAGAQVHNDMLACWAIRRKGWTLLYDPLVCVDHYLGKRHGVDQRGRLSSTATFDRAFNLRLAVAEIQPARLQIAVILWQLLVGTRDSPGLLWVLRFMLMGRGNIMAGYRATRAGWCEAEKILSTKGPPGGN